MKKRVATLLVLLAAGCSSKKEQPTALQTSQSFEKRQRELPKMVTEQEKK